MSVNHSIPLSKVCKKCGIDKQLDEFHKSPSCKLGRRPVCKECRKPEINAYSATHKEEAKLRAKQYYHGNREHCLKVSSDWQKRNKEITNARKKKWRDSEKGKLYMKEYGLNRDPLKKSAANAKWYEKNKYKAYLQGSEWRNKNRAQVASYRRNRRAAMKLASGTHTGEDIQRLFKLQKGKCGNCKVSISSGYHVDHRIPISKGGSNDPGNLELLCKTCNLKKSNLMPDDFAWKQGRLL